MAVALNQSPRAMALVLAAELVTLGRIVPRRRPVTHSGDFGWREQLKLSHGKIVPHAAQKLWPGSVFDHAIFGEDVPISRCVEGP
jgi:hypothetical protein